MFPSKPKTVASTPMSEFIRNASSERKNKEYKVVLKKATERQNEVMGRKLPIGLDGRARDQNAAKAGQIREKRADTKVATLRKEYGADFAKGFRSDAHLGTVREKTGESLHQLVNKTKK
jgi:hypothetical protein